jgi:hypothetical protein
MIFLTVILSTSHLHLAGRQGQFARAAKVNGCYPLLNQVSEVAVVGGWKEGGRSSVVRSEEYKYCERFVGQHQARYVSVSFISWKNDEETM